MNINIDTDYIEKNPIIDRYQSLVQACGNINQLYKDKKVNENLTSDAVNSKIKQEATFVVTKYQDLNMLEDFPDKEKPIISKHVIILETFYQRKNLKNMEERSQEKFNLVSQIDSFMIKNGKNPPKRLYLMNHPRQIEEESNKTVSLINEIENKLNKRKKKNNKDISVSVHKKIIDL